MDSTPIDRVILQEEVKLWRCERTVAYLDSPVYNFDETELEIASPVPVYSPEMEKIGFASVRLDHDGKEPCLVASISIDYATEERFEAELNIRPLYPRVFGRMVASQTESVFDFQARLKVHRLLIEGVKLTITPPTDARILKLPEESI